jgi:hypothetical protein
MTRQARIARLEAKHGGAGDGPMVIFLCDATMGNRCWTSSNISLANWPDIGTDKSAAKYSEREPCKLANVLDLHAQCVPTLNSGAQWRRTYVLA